MRDCVLLVDLFNDFRHEDGDVLLACFRERFPDLQALIQTSRQRATPIIYANDSFGIFDGDAGGVVERARRGQAGNHVEVIAPRREDRFVVKPRYSAFDHTPLALILGDLGIERILLAGMSTERCVTQTAIGGRESGFKITVVASACCTVDLELEEIALAYLERVVGVRVAASLAEAIADEERTAAVPGRPSSRARASSEPSQPPRAEGTESPSEGALGAG
jgi:nicotinamidase-related amidase